MEATQPVIDKERLQDSLRPLQIGGRHRETHVEAQIRLLLECDPYDFWRRARRTDRNTPDFVSEEALVYILREKYCSGDMKSAGDIAELLVERCTSFLHRQIAAWKISASHAEDCAYDVLSQLWHDLFNLAPSCEFWEIRFWLCLKRRLLNCVQKYRAVDQAEVNPNPLDDGQGHETDFFEAQIARPALTPQQKLEIQEALALLPDKERMAFILYYYEDWTQQEIASRLHTTDRTIRNMLGRAEERLASWRNGK